MKNTVSIIFFPYKSRLNSKGEALLYCRITYLKERQQFSTGIHIQPTYWDKKTSKINGAHPLSSEHNQQLLNIESQLMRHWFSLIDEGTNLTTKGLLKLYRGESKEQQGLLQVFNHHNGEIESLVGKEYALSTYKKFEYLYQHVKGFINTKFKQRDRFLSELDFGFILDFEFYLKTEAHQKQITVNKYIQRLRKVVRYSIQKQWLDKDPFYGYKPKKVNHTVTFLTKDELKLLEATSIAQERLRIARDMFIFSCYTGLAYYEALTLTQANIQPGFDGQDWIVINRKKTDKELRIPILQVAQNIIDNYRHHPLSRKRGTLLPLVSNQQINSYLKEIADIVGIHKRLTHHVGRKTFASTVLLFNSVPMEVVSMLLGHSSVTITEQYYGKVVQKQVSSEILLLKKRLRQID